MARERYVLKDGFQTMDGRRPHYIRASEEARKEYERLRGMGFAVLRPGKVLSENEFEKLAEASGCFEVANPGDPNDNGYLMVAIFESSDEARVFFQELASEGKRALALPEEIGEDDFIQMAKAGELVNLRTLRKDGTVRVLRGIIVGSSESFLRLRQGFPDDSEASPET